MERGSDASRAVREAFSGNTDAGRHDFDLREVMPRAEAGDPEAVLALRGFMRTTAAAAARSWRLPEGDVVDQVENKVWPNRFDPLRPLPLKQYGRTFVPRAEALAFAAAHRATRTTRAQADL